jgi:2-keto-4-pentenoate hydratase
VHLSLRLYILVAKSLFRIKLNYPDYISCDLAPTQKSIKYVSANAHLLVNAVRHDSQRVGWLSNLYLTEKPNGNTQMNESHEKLAKSLADAWLSGGTIPLPAAEDAPVSRTEAYAIQDKMAESIGCRVSGWKVGAAVKAVQFFENHDGPLPGRVFEDRTFDVNAVVPAALYNGAKVESEFAFRLTDPLPPGTDPVTVADLQTKIAFHPAIELSAARYAPGTGGRAATTFDGIADNGTAGAAVLGDAVDDWRDLPFERMVIDARIDDSPPIQAYSKIYRRNPVEIMAETLSDLRQRGVNFEPGMFLLTGSLTIPTPIRKRQKLTVKIGDFPLISLLLE